MTLVLTQESDGSALRSGLCNCRPVLELLLMVWMPSPCPACDETPVRVLGTDPLCRCGFVKGPCSCSGCLAGADRPVPNTHVSRVPRCPERLNPSNQPGAVFTGPGGRDPAGQRGGCVCVRHAGDCLRRPSTASSPCSSCGSCCGHGSPPLLCAAASPLDSPRLLKDSSRSP